ATGPATRDGKMIVGHVTWWSQTLAEQTNVMLDIKPERGHRMLIQSYPGGIESGTDWYQNDAGMVLTETTIRQSPFNIEGTPVAFRARRAIQYGGNVDEVVEQLGTRNNGLYTNEWIIADAKTNEIAMYELGTNHTKLWRSSKNEWFGDTPGFYWGNNNAKDLAVNLEYHPDPRGEPEYIPYVPRIRDLAWQDLYARNRGNIDEQFAFLAFRTAPLVSATTMDAKVATADMANHFMVWAAIGRPNQSVWTGNSAPNHGLYPGGYHLFDGQRPQAGRAAESLAEQHNESSSRRAEYKDRLWKGWVLPASHADIWFVAGSAKYYQILRSGEVDRAIDNENVMYRGLKLCPDDAIVRFRREETRGVLFLDSLRRKMGDEAFFKLMSEFFATNTTKAVTAQSFLERAGVAFNFTEPEPGPVFLMDDITRRLNNAAIVYGTVLEQGTNRYAAEQLQSRYRESAQTEVPIRKDFEVSDDELRHRDVIFIGRPETNSALAAWSSKIGLDYQNRLFRMDGKTYASERSGLAYAAQNPLDGTKMVVVYAGNDPLSTVRSLDANTEAPFSVLEAGNVQKARGL
ncbi:MAG: hypothetical protein JOZ62_15635, partial [Acidobacteriaceae bacterium]|nr:hypothetical protein [Acidobacteriaceae bacterium]